MKTTYSDSTMLVVEVNADGRGALVNKLLLQPLCAIVRSPSVSWSTGNSVVTSSPVLSVTDIFTGHKAVNVTASLVQINGRTDEPVHYHTSHVVGMVVSGRGFFLTSREAGAREFDVTPGDLVIIPQGAMHYFVSDEPMAWIALEVSHLPIDYQKHYTDEERTALKRDAD